MNCRTKLWKAEMQPAVTSAGTGGCFSVEGKTRNCTCKIGDSAFIPELRSEFCNCAVGPWVSVSGRGTALARGNPAN